MEFENVRKNIARQLDIPEESITMESRLIEDLKADSLDVVELIMDHPYRWRHSELHQQEINPSGKHRGRLNNAGSPFFPHRRKNGRG